MIEALRSASLVSLAIMLTHLPMGPSSASFVLQEHNKSLLVSLHVFHAQWADLGLRSALVFASLANLGKLQQMAKREVLGVSSAPLELIRSSMADPSVCLAKKGCHSSE